MADEDDNLINTQLNDLNLKTDNITNSIDATAKHIENKAGQRSTRENINVNNADAGNSNSDTKKVPVDKNEYCEHWLEDSEFSEDLESCDSSSVYSSSVADTEYSADDHTLSTMNNLQVSRTQNIASVFNDYNSGHQNFGSVSVVNSEQVQLGNVTYVTGPVKIVLSGKESRKLTKDIVRSKPNNEEETLDPDYFLGKAVDPRVNNGTLRILLRKNWLAQPPLERNVLETPVNYVIISHTATESSTSQAENVFFVRTVQTFHIESQGWADIAYNFLVGCDSNVYEGRGWNLAGAHTYGYNKIAIGISFVGCFISELPPEAALRACQMLIQRGVDLGHISKNYRLLGHCQCSAVESPGKALYQEIQTWPHWTEQIS